MTKAAFSAALSLHVVQDVLYLFERQTQTLAELAQQANKADVLALVVGVVRHLEALQRKVTQQLGVAHVVDVHGCSFLPGLVAPGWPL